MTKEYTMPFGKHKGKPLSKIPKNYLGWLIANVPIHGELKNAVSSTLQGKEVERPFNLAEEVEMMFKQTPQ